MTSHVTFQQGVKECIPTLLGYIGIGLSFGIVAASRDFSVLEILLLCLLVYAGAAQFIICALVITGTPISAIVLTTLIVNSRFFLLSMTLSPNYKDYGIWNRLALSSLLTDETFGVAITPHLKGETINDRWLHGLNITAYSFWAMACVLGAIFGKYISHPEMLGLDFAITAMFIFLAMAQFETITRSKISIYIVLIAFVIVMMFILSWLMPSYVAILVTSICLCNTWGGDGSMTITGHMLLLIVLCGLVTLIVRVVPFLMISRIQLSETVIKWLSFIPISLFTALVIDSFIVQHKGMQGFELNIPFIVATIPTVIIAVVTRSLTITIIVGIIFIAGIRWFF